MALSAADSKRNIFFRRSYNSGTLYISSLKLLNIPNQATRIFVKAKQARNWVCAPPAKIFDNSVTWNLTLELPVRIPEKPPSKKSLLLRFSVRLENPAGRGYIRYGVVATDITMISRGSASVFTSELQGCNYHSQFQCKVLLHPKSQSGILMELEPPVANIPQSRSLPKLERPTAAVDLSDDGEVASDDEALLFDFPVPVSPGKLQLLSQQVDEALAAVLREESLRH
jgi:hypothetical protein